MTSSGKEIKFPPNFLWGCATSAHQIEGGNFNNQWWWWEQQPDKIHQGDTSERACDHWNLYEVDFDFLSKLNVNAYRMSIEWSRIFPRPNELDHDALEHYHKMIDTLLNRNITPFITLHHFTVPLWWHETGGFKNDKKTHLDHFRQFVEVVVNEFKEKIKFWNTINEPNVVAVIGHYVGIFPPGETSFRSTIKATNTLLKMHAIAYHAIKNIDPTAQAGLVMNLTIIKPYRPKSLQDRALAKFADYLYNGAVLRGLKTGKLFLGIFRKWNQLKDSNDFIGLNYYTFALISRKFPELMRVTTDYPDPEKLCAGLGWEPYPEGLLIALRRLQKMFPKLPIYVTENGIGTDNDEWRQQFIIDHLKVLHRAIQEGMDVRGYFHWSLIDNFEWAEGYSSRFGLVHVDHETQKRTMKKSGELYAEIAKHNGIPPKLLEKYEKSIYQPSF